jgi:natural resistance-associated macrophage protein 2
VDRKDEAKVREANMYNAVESTIALFVSFIINLFVVGVFAKAFYTPANPNTTIACVCVQVWFSCRLTSGAVCRLDSAGDELGKIYGNSARYIWAIGLLAAGQSSTMTGEAWRA